MAKAGLLFIGTDDGIILLSNPGTAGRWLRVGHELRGRAVHGIWVRHDDPRLVVAATSGGVERSDDSGATWRTLAPGDTRVLMMAAGEPLRLLVATDHGVLRGYDPLADTWVADDSIAAGILPTHSDAATLPGAQPVVLRAVSDTILRSSDGGVSWEATRADPPFDTISVIGGSGYHMDTAFAGTLAGRLFVTTDRGRSWQLVRDGMPPIHAIAAARLA
ncbi:MAG TPA: hypothetical protein PKC19_11725 [Roseiflexaceae bacterium]|nr:hypothetical protein [Roseiflexaceae bacterium]